MHCLGLHHRSKLFYVTASDSHLVPPLQTITSCSHQPLIEWLHLACVICLSVNGGSEDQQSSHSMTYLPQLPVLLHLESDILEKHRQKKPGEKLYTGISFIKMVPWSSYMMHCRCMLGCVVLECSEKCVIDRGNPACRKINSLSCLSSVG